MSNPQPTTKRRLDKDGPDFFPTSPVATEALIRAQTLSPKIWEPACGRGDMVEVLGRVGFEVFYTDKFDRGMDDVKIVDFLEATEDDLPEDFLNNPFDIVTNPPYAIAEKFLQHALNFRPRPMRIALLLRLAFLEGQRRYDRIFSKTPPSKVLVFSKRLTFYPGGVQTAGSGTVAYAWFIWDDWTEYQETRLGWI